MSSHQAPSQHRIPELDGLRGVAALMVVMWHFTGSMVVGLSPLGDAVYAATIFGRSGVDLFFVLSGFLIIGILLDQRGAVNLFRVFYTRRVFRIVPPYMTLIAIYWFCYGLLGESPAFNTNHGALTQLAAQVTFTWNLLMAWVDGPVARAFSVAWFVSIEEYFYLVFPALILMTPREQIWKLLLAVGLASAIGRAGYYLWNPGSTLAPYVVTPFRLDGLCAGGLLALGYRNAIVRLWLERFRSQLTVAAAVLALSVPFVIAATRDDLLRQMYLWGHVYLTLVYSTVLLAVLFNPGSVRFLRTFLLRTAGQISYSLYLFHPLFLSLFFELARRPERIETWGDGLLAAGSLTTTVIFCIGLYVYMERPSQHFGHRSKYRSESVGRRAPQPSPEARDATDYALAKTSAKPRLIDGAD